MTIVYKNEHFLAINSKSSINFITIISNHGKAYTKLGEDIKIYSR